MKMFTLRSATLRIPRDGGHDSMLMADSIPASSRTPFDGDGGQVWRHLNGAKVASKVRRQVHHLTATVAISDSSVQLQVLEPENPKAHRDIPRSSVTKCFTAWNSDTKN